MRVSFILAVHDGARTLGDCLAHLSAQRFTDWECIAVDDASADQSAAILVEHARRDGRLKVLTHCHNEGVSATRNTGLAAASAEFVHFLDQDDHLLPDGIGELLRAVRGSPHAAAFSGSCFLVNKDRRVLLDFRGPDYDITFPEVCRSNCIMVPATLCRRACVLEVGGMQAGLEGCDDWDLWGRLTRTGRPIRRCKIAVSEYRVHGANSSLNSRRQFAKAVQALDRMHAPDPRVPKCDPRWQDGMPPEGRVPALLLLMWANAAVQAFAGRIEGAVGVVEEALTLIPAGEIRLESAGLLHDVSLFASMFAGVDPRRYLSQCRTSLGVFFSHLEHLLQQPGFADHASAALQDRYIQAMAGENEYLAEQVRACRESRSFRLGQLLATPLRWLRHNSRQLPPAGPTG